MEHQAVYVCTGGCNGVSPVAKSCGAASCPHYNKPLEAREQCDACAQATERDSGRAHACSSCKAA